MLKLESVTTEYIDVEDRVRLTAITANTITVQLWLTPRLLQRFLPKLFEWLQKNHPGTLKEQRQRHERQNHSIKHQGQTTTSIQPAIETIGWLVTSIEMSYNAKTIQLIFKGKKEEAAVLLMDVRLLRQWLEILLVAYRAAEWPLTNWPQQFTSAKIRKSNHQRWYHITTPANA
jgi:hypothetical protein